MSGPEMNVCAIEVNYEGQPHYCWVPEDDWWETDSYDAHIALLSTGGRFKER